MFSRNLHRKQQLSLFFLSFTPTPTRACVRVYLSVRRRGGEKEERSSPTPPRLAQRRVVAPTWPPRVQHSRSTRHAAARWPTAGCQSGRSNRYFRAIFGRRGHREHPPSGTEFVLKGRK